MIGMKEKFDMQANTNDGGSQKQGTPVHTNNVVYVEQSSRYVKVVPNKPMIQNDDDDIMNMLDDLENDIPV